MLYVAPSAAAWLFRAAGRSVESSQRPVCRRFSSTWAAVIVSAGVNAQCPARWTKICRSSRPSPAWSTILDAIFAELRPQPVEKSALRDHIPVDPDVFDKAFEKLWIYGGAVLDYAENVSVGQGHWRETYIAQGKRKRAQIEQMIRIGRASRRARVAVS